MNVFTVTWNDADPECFRDNVGWVGPYAAFKTLEEAIGQVANTLRGEANGFLEEDREDPTFDPEVTGWLELIAVGYGDDAVCRQVGTIDDSAVGEGRWTLAMGPNWPGEPGTFVVSRLDLGVPAPS